MKIILCLLFVFLFTSGCSIHNLKGLDKDFVQTRQKINNLVDINGDKRSDLVFWNYSNENCFFETLSIQNTNYQVANVGNIGDIPVYGDFTGDGNTDYGVYQNSQGNNKWYLIDGSTMVSFWERYGKVGDLPIPSDYDGDGKCDLVVYRPSNSGFYGLLSNKNKMLEVHFGITGDIPVPKDYDGDSKADLAVYTLSSGTWLIRSSSNNSLKKIKLGESDYLPIPGDYDGDGAADLAVWNYKNNHCKIIFSSFFDSKLSEKISMEIQEKLKGIKCFPLSSDYYGDGRSELAFWEYGNDLVHLFKISGNNFKYEQFQVSIKDNSQPVNYFLLNKFLNRVNNVDHKYLFKKYLAFAGNNENKFKCDFDGDLLNDHLIYDSNKKAFLIKVSSSGKEEVVPFSVDGDVLADDFDGDGRCDLGYYDADQKMLSYFSSALGSQKSLYFDIRSEGKPFSADLDLDFMSDLVLYDPKTKIFGFVLSSEDYRYDEVLFMAVGVEG